MEKHMKVEEEKVTKLKNEANDLFNQGKLLDSLNIYEKGLKKWRRFLEKSGHDFENTENHLLSVFYSNIGLCHKNLYISGDVSHYSDNGSSITRVSRLEAALDSYSQAINADPLWEKIHLRKSVVFQMIKDVYISDEGVLDSLDAVKDRKKANIIVDMTQTCPRRKVNNQIMFNDFQKALDACKGGDQIFLEVGIYKFERSVKIDKQITLVGASTGVILRCNNIGGGSLEEARANPVAAFTILATELPPGSQIVLKRLRFQMMLYVKSGFRVSVEQCLFDGETYFVTIQVDPIPRSKDKIPKEWRKMVNWDGSEKKKTIESVPIILRLHLCMFIRCWRKNPLMVKGEAVHVSLEHSMLEEGLGIVVRHGAVMAFKDCELKGGAQTEETNLDLAIMCSNKSRLHLISTNVLTEGSVSGVGVMFAYKTLGDVNKSLFQYTGLLTSQSSLYHIVIEEANVTVQRSLFLNKSTAGLKKASQIGIALRRQYSSSSKILQNKFVNCSPGIHLNNGASPTIHANTFSGNTRNHVYLSGGANPNIVENIFDLTEKTKGEASLGVCYEGGSGGILAKNRFIKATTSICIDEISMPFLLENVYEDRIPNEAKVESAMTTYIIIHVNDGNTFINSVEEEKAVMKSLKAKREKVKEPLRLCAGCKKYKACDLCGKCKSSYYCSPECQRSHWKKHEKSCNEIETLRKDGGEVFIAGKQREPCHKGCPNWTKNNCQHCKLPSN